MESSKYILHENIHIAITGVSDRPIENPFETVGEMLVGWVKKGEKRNRERKRETVAI